MPARLAAALRRALALAPGQRWPDAPSFAQGLASPSGAMRGAGIAAVAALLALSAWRLLQPPATDPWGPGDATPGTPTGRRAWQQAEGLYAAGRWREADDAFATALRLKPDFVEARVNLGKTRLDRGRVDEALTILREALRQRPDFAEARVNHGIPLRAKGRNEEAIAENRNAGSRPGPFSPPSPSFLGSRAKRTDNGR